MLDQSLLVKEIASPKCHFVVFVEVDFLIWACNSHLLSPDLSMVIYRVHLDSCLEKTDVHALASVGQVRARSLEIS